MARPLPNKIRRISQGGMLLLATAVPDCTVMPSDTVSGSMITSDAATLSTRLKALPTWVASVTVPDSCWLVAFHCRPCGSDEEITDQVKLPFAFAPLAARF